MYAICVIASHLAAFMAGIIVMGWLCANKMNGLKIAIEHVLEHVLYCERTKLCVDCKRLLEQP